MEKKKLLPRDGGGGEGGQHRSICIVSLILPEVWIPRDQYPATASLFFCVTYYCL